MLRPLGSSRKGTHRVPVVLRRTENVRCALLDLIAACTLGSEIWISAATARGLSAARGTRDATLGGRGAHMTGPPSALYLLPFDLLPAPILSTAIGERFASPGEAELANRLLSALRFELGGRQENRP